MSSAQAPARTRPATSSTSSTRPATRAARPRTAPGPYPGPDDQWQERGACRTANPALFFAPENEGPHQRRFRESAAKAICAHCPVRALCRAYAVQTDEPYGIWGGTTERERQTSPQPERKNNTARDRQGSRNDSGTQVRPLRRASNAVAT
jgi:WhiB family redox-sensing transcriptional regulator